MALCSTKQNLIGSAVLIDLVLGRVGPLLPNAILAFLQCEITLVGKSSESVQCVMLKACGACADIGQL